jgi:hypothetical protein
MVTEQRLGGAQRLSGAGRWVLRDRLAAAALFITTAAVVFWQNAHVAVLWDLSYALDSAARIAQGQLPYRDFPFAHAPLTFLIQAAIIRLTGRVFFHHVLYAAVIGGLGTVLTFRIALHSLVGRVNAAWPIALILATPLSVLGIYSILPLPSYDCDCVFAVLVAIWALQSLKPSSTRLYGLVTGASLCVPLFFKQNIGLPFLAAACGFVILALAACLVGLLKPPAFSLWTRPLLAVLTGTTATFIAALLLLHFTVGLGNYLHWTIKFAAQRRLPGLQQMLGVYRDPELLWTLPCIVTAIFLLRSDLPKKLWAQILTLGLLAVPFIYTLCTLFIYDDADERGDSLLALWPLLLILAAVVSLWNLRSLRSQPRIGPFLPILLLVAIHGTLMSQQLWGSTYAIWPLLILLIADMLAFLAEFKSTGLELQRIVPAIAAIIAVTLLVCGSFYIASEERLSYAQLPAGPMQHSAFPQLKGMSIAGPYLPDLDELLRYADANIPRSDGLILIPGEDPFYFVTGRTPQFPVLLFDPATDPLSPAQVVEEARERHIRWLIVKRNLQLTADPTPQREATLNLLMDQFAPVAHLHAYDIYQIR